MSETTTPQTPSQSCERISLKEIRKELYEQRKAEAQDLRKKLIFFAIVTTVLALLYISLITTLITIYRSIIPSYAYSSDYSRYALYLYDFLEDYNDQNIGSCLIAIIGLIASITWLKKAKKSQARTSICEQRICQIEQALTLEIPKDYRIPKESPYTLRDLFHTEEAKFHTDNRGSILLGKATTVFWWMAFSLHTACVLSLAYGKLVKGTWTAFYESLELYIKIIFVLLCTVPIAIIYLLKKRNTKH